MSHVPLHNSRFSILFTAAQVFPSGKSRFSYQQVFIAKPYLSPWFRSKRWPPCFKQGWSFILRPLSGGSNENFDSTRWVQQVEGYVFTLEMFLCIPYPWLCCLTASSLHHFYPGVSRKRKWNLTRMKWWNKDRPPHSQSMCSLFSLVTSLLWDQITVTIRVWRK